MKIDKGPTQVIRFSINRMLPPNSIAVTASDERTLDEARDLMFDHQYPHMCRDGHPEVGYKTDECPVCKQITHRTLSELPIGDQA